MQKYRITLNVTENIMAESEEDAINQMTLDGYKYDVEKLDEKDDTVIDFSRRCEECQGVGFKTKKGELNR